MDRGVMLETKGRRAYKTSCTIVFSSSKWQLEFVFKNMISEITVIILKHTTVTVDKKKLRQVDVQ